MRTLPAGDGVRLVRDVLIPMRDGTSLAADLYVPDGPAGGTDLPEQPLPVVMDYIPYRKDEVDPRAMRHYLELPRHGYIVARVDIRGTGGSEGDAVDEYVPGEQVDGYDAIEWIAAQPWCDGHVNMMGISYGGFTALQVATLQPPHLTSIIPVDFTDDRYTDDCHYRGGLLRMYYDLGWYGTRMIAWNAMPTDAIVASDDRGRGRGGATSPGTSRISWRGCVTRSTGRTGARGRSADVADRIACPAFLIGGWRDGYPNPPLRLFERLAGPTQAADRAVGPRAIRTPRSRTAHRPPARGRPLARPLVPRHRHRDHGRAADRGVSSRTGSRRRRIGSRRRASGGPRRPGRRRGRPSRRSTSAPGGRWPPTPAADDRRRHARLRPDGGDRRAACGRAACRSGCPATSAATRRCSLVYTSEPLDAPLTILGRARARSFTWRRRRRVMGVAVSLSDVDPDGTSQLVAKGMLNGTRRHSLTEPEPLEPGRGRRAGHRHRCDGLAVPARASHARWRSRRRTGRTCGPRRRSATLTVHHGPARPIAAGRCPSCPTRATPATVVRAVARSLSATPSAFEPPATWSVSEDALTGRVAVTIQLETRPRHAAGEPDRARLRLRRARWTRGPGACDRARLAPLFEHSRRPFGRGRAPTSSWHPTPSDFHLTIDLAVTIDDERPSPVAGSSASHASCSETNEETRWPHRRHASADDSPLQVVTARTLFETAPVGRRNAASVIRIESTGRLLMCFSHVVGAALRNQAALVASHSDDDGETWSDPETVYAYPGWFSLAMGGLARVADDNVKMILGRMRIDSQPRRHGADDRLVGRLIDHPRWRRQLGRARPRRSASSRTGPSCTEPATRTRSPTDACCGRPWARWVVTSAGTPG